VSLLQDTAQSKVIPIQANGDKKLIDIPKEILKNFDAVGGFCINIEEMKKHPNYELDVDVSDIDLGMEVVDASIENKNLKITLQSPSNKLQCIIAIIIPIKKFEDWDVIVDSKKRLLDEYRSRIDPYGVCDD